MPLTDAEKVQLARRSLAFFIGWTHKTDMQDTEDGHAVPQPHHLQIIERMEAVAAIVLHLPGWEKARQERHTAIVAPPGSAKTFLLAAYYEWMIGQASLRWGDNWADMFHIGHISHEAKQAWRLSYAVREVVEKSDIFHLVFPKVEPTGKWSEGEWRVEGCIGKDPTFAALGIGGGIPGFRWNIAGLDDLIKPEAVKESNVSPADVESVIYTVDKVVMKRLVEGGCALLANTRWYERDPTSWAMDQGWTHLRIQALDENDESFWPDRQNFTTEELLAERQRDPEGFALQFMGEPAPAEGIEFKREWLGYEYDQLPWKDAEDRLNYISVASWDTAQTRNKRSDYTAGWEAVVNLRTFDMYLLNLHHEKLETPEVIDAIRACALSELRPQFVWVEEKSTGLAAIQSLEREGVRIDGVAAYGQRGSISLQVVTNQAKIMLSRGQIHFPSQRFALAHGMEWVEMSKRALLMYPRGQHDDIARAFIQLVFETFRAQQYLGIYDPNQKQLTWGEPEGERVRV